MEDGEARRIEGLRRRLGFRYKWDVVLATPIIGLENNGSSRMMRTFYRDIASEIESLGKSCFLPDRDYQKYLGFKGKKVAKRCLLEIVVPSADLLFYHHQPEGENLHNSMIHAGYQMQIMNDKPDVWTFIEEERTGEIHGASDIDSLIPFRNFDEGIEQITSVVQATYDLE